MRWWLLFVGFLLALAAGAAEAPALMKAGPGVMGHGLNVKSSPAISSAFPGDAAAFTAWWGLRPYNQSKCSGFVDAVRLRRASDNAEASINIKTDCELNISLASSHCAATNCFVTKIFDQVAGNACGGSCDVVQTTVGSQPSWVFNCSGLAPCIEYTTASISLMSVGNLTPASGVSSIAVVTNRLSGTVVQLVAQTTALNRMQAQGVNTWRLAGGTSGTVERAAADGAWHVGVGVINGVGSSLTIDGVATAGTVTGSTTAAQVRVGVGAASTTQRLLEGGIVDNVALSPAQANALYVGARAAYGLP